MSGKLETMLARLFRRGDRTAAPAHQAELEQALLARYGELHPKSRKERTMGAIVLWRAAVQAVEAGGTFQQVRVRGTRAGDGPMRTTIELYGETAAQGDLPAIMRRAAPVLAALPITVEPIERTVQGELGDKVKRLVGMDHLAPDELARLIEAELREADPSAAVEVQVEQSEGRREVRVEVKKEAPAPEGGEVAPR